MPNIKQQKKRVRIAAEERLENLRYASTVKTFTRRLNAAVAEGDQDRIAAERPGELELPRQLAAPFEGHVEPREANDRVGELVGAEVPRLLVELLDIEAVPLQLFGCRPGGDARGRELLAIQDPADVHGQQAAHA